MNVAAVQRNAPCPCGSGKRYKNCHGAIVNDGALGDDEIAALVDQALEASAQDRHVDATRLFQRVLAARPGDIVAEHNLALIRMQRGDAAGAIPALERTAAARPDDPGFHDNLGLAYSRTDRFDEALAAFGRALALNERRPGTWSNLGNALRQLARYDDAEAAFKRSLEIDPTFAKARWHYATSLLARNDPAGWEGYENRWVMFGANDAPSMPGVPRYRGEDPAGLTIVVEDEQGFGDALQGIRHVKALADRGARVVVRTWRAGLASLFASAPGVAEVVRFDATPPCDAWIPLMSLPGLLGIEPSGDGQGPYLRADPSLVADVRERLMRTPARLRVGLSWAGNPMQENNRRRCVPLAALAPLLERDGVAWYSLQRVDGEDEIAGVPAARALHSPPERLEFDTKAALVEALDLVVSVCTSNAHLAGALGRPLWLMLSHVVDWRWGDRVGTTTAWYPHARVFRQPSRGDWGSVVSSVGAALDERLRA